MNTPSFIAQRYLLAKKSHNLINIVTWISIISICVATFAMIFVLSVFNGFNMVISDMIHQFSPDLNISAVKGKTININDLPLEKIKNIEDVDYVFPTITEDVLFNAEKADAAIMETAQANRDAALQRAKEQGLQVKDGKVTDESLKEHAAKAGLDAFMKANNITDATPEEYEKQFNFNICQLLDQSELLRLCV